MLFIDIDRFKNVNKSFGLVIGDSMLLTLGRRLSRHLNPQDTLARLGGDQFAILLISETDPHHVATLAERVRRALRTPMKISSKEIILTASIGIVVHDSSQATAQDMLREGELAMLRAKRGGADRIEIFNPAMRGEDESKLPLESDLRKALERQQIAVLYQPITRLASNQLAGFEALMRWDHPTHGRLGAEDFIPLAEESGLIVELGSYVLGQALEEAGRWHKLLPRDRDPLFVSVNVSSRQLFRQDMVQEIRLMLAREAVPKGTLKLEITESLVMENPERAVEILTWLKTFGAESRARRFRHRLQLAQLSAPLSGRHHQGRSLAGARQWAQRLDPAHPPLGDRAVARARQGSGGRRRRDPGRRQLSALDRLRVWPGLLLRRADVGQGRGQPALRPRQSPQTPRTRTCPRAGRAERLGCAGERPVAAAGSSRWYRPVNVLARGTR